MLGSQFIIRKIHNKCSLKSIRKNDRVGRDKMIYLSKKYFILVESLALNLLSGYDYISAQYLQPARIKTFK